MKIIIDISPVSSGSTSQHKVRGVGYYIEHLQQALQTNSPNNVYVFVSDIEKVSLDSDILHIPYFDPFFTHLPKRKKLPTVITIHDLIPLVYPQHFPAGLRGKVKWNLQKYIVKQSDAIITDSLASKKDSIRILGYPEKNIHVIYLAADEQFRKMKIDELKSSNIKKKYQLPEKFVLYVGDATWNKNVPRLINACKKINVPLVMVGQALSNKNFDRNNFWNRDLVEVERLVDGIENIFRLGFVSTEELVELYNVATVFAFPSLYEGFGLPVLEAMQSGCPVVTTKNGSLPEVCGSAVLYTEAESMSSIAESVKRVFEDTTMQNELREKGIEQAKKFTWQKTVEQTVAVYKKVYESNNK